MEPISAATPAGLPGAGRCDGKGWCLQQVDENQYERAFNCEHKCVPVKCPNFAVCGAVDPRFIYDMEGGVCINCVCTFGGALDIKELRDECPVCLEPMGRGAVKFVQCAHRACARCFRRLHWGDLDGDDESGREEEMKMQFVISCPLCRAMLPDKPWELRKEGNGGDGRG